MPQVDPDLEKQVESNPDDTFHLIVRVDGDLDVREEQLQADGFTIKRRLRLIRGFAAAARGCDVLSALQETWIVAIEEDRQVTTMNTDDDEPTESN